MGAVIVANRYVPRPPDDLPALIASLPPSDVLLAALAANVPFSPHFWSANTDDPPVWRGRPGATSLIQLLPPQAPSGSPAMATVYVPSPPRDDPWVASSRPLPEVLLQASQPTPFAVVRRDMGLAADSLWTGESGGANWLLSNTLQLYMAASARVIPYEDTAPWVRTAAPANVLLLQAQPGPFVPSIWRQNYDDFPPVLIVSGEMPAQIKQLLAGPPVLPTRWRFDHNDASVANLRSTPMSSSLLPQPQVQPFVPVSWDQNIDDPAVQSTSTPIAPVLSLSNGGYPAIPRRWRVPGDDPGVWTGSPGNVSVTLQQLLNVPFTPSTWRVGPDDATPAGIPSVPVSAVLRKLAAGSLVIAGRWRLDYDDASFRPGGTSAPPSRELLDALTANVPFKPVYVMPGIDEAVISVRAFNRGALALPSSIILNPNYIARGDPRQRIIIGISNQMAATNPLIPPIDSSVEIETVTFDFGRIMDPGVVITSVQSLTCAVWKANVAGASDPTPQARVVGAAQIVASPNSGGTSQAVSQLVGTMVAGIVYRLQCVVTTSDGQALSLWSHLECDAPD